MSLAVSLPPTMVRSLPIADVGDLLTRLPPPQDGVLAWVRGGDGLVGWGELARLDVQGPDAFATAASWWEEQCSSMVVDDAVGLAGSGPVCFGSAAFDRRTAGSVFIVPRVVLGRRDGRSWLTAFGSHRGLPAPACPAGPRTVAYADGALSQAEWCGAVAAAVERIRCGELDKVVLARDLLARTEPAVDVRFLLQRLALRYPDCWTFAVDGLVGATPELLVSRRGREVTSRVLAGTVRRGRDAEDDRLVAELIASSKDQEEHRYAVRSVADALAPYCRELRTPATPDVLRLATVAHLATVVTGRLAVDAAVLHLVDALHPTAAVCGTPTSLALDVIPELEKMDRGRYAGPVGWMDSAGDGDWGIALRCAALDNERVRLFAGCGVVAGSDPDAELAESHAKLVTIRDALEGL
ncbi:MAG: isochorismate synthase [Geodermatophilaceae bacterium]